MRVIAGSAKGTRLAPVPTGTRPLSDRAREGLFSSLGSEVEGARCADLYAGTGAVGIEALSRGAESCLFVDGSGPAIRTIRDNLVRTGFEDRSRVVRASTGRALEREREPLDVAFLDPPYDAPAEDLRRVLSQVTVLISPRGALVLTRAKRDSTDVVPVHWPVDRLLTYGDARILICREAT
ncbi:MAG TPA: RsmD family RNA methyltransferase [Actinomycetota bacterium]|nr:RsmD family RNA methyltransferase [Actinomycetota bacterium]